MHLYWVETEDHHEDWFVIADNRAKAETFFAEYEGYDEDMASATQVCEIKNSELPPDFYGADWANKETLIALGATLENHNEARVVHLNGRTYAEGMLESVIRVCDHIQQLNVSAGTEAFEDLTLSSDLTIGTQKNKILH